MSSALAQTLQTPGVSGMENNTVLFELSVHDGRETAQEVVEGCRLACAARMNLVVLRHGDHFFGDRKAIDVWITEGNYRNASLMILLAYIVLGHPDWDGGEIRIFSAAAQERLAESSERLRTMIAEGRLPISEQNVRILPIAPGEDVGPLMEQWSSTASLVLAGFTAIDLDERGGEVFRVPEGIGDLLLVSAGQPVFID
jgi:hypothetical protein